MRALAALGSVDPESQDMPTVRFVGWPKVVATVPEGIGVESGRAVAAIEKLIHRQYCALKYGTFRLRHLTKADRAATRLDVTYPDPTRMVVDLSRPATAMAAVARARGDADGQFSESQGGLFRNPDGQSNESWPRAAREIGLEVVRKVTPAKAALLATRALIVAGLVLASPTLWSETLKHRQVMQQQADSHQVRLAELERTTIIAQAGKPAAPAAHHAVERAIDADAQNMRALVSSDYSGPFYRFINAAEYARPALLDLARTSTIDVNGLTLDARTAKALAKAIRRTPGSGWDAVVQPAATQHLS